MRRLASSPHSNKKSANWAISSGSAAQANGTTLCTDVYSECSRCLSVFISQKCGSGEQGELSSACIASTRHDIRKASALVTPDFLPLVAFRLLGGQCVRGSKPLTTNVIDCIEKFDIIVLSPHHSLFAFRPIAPELRHNMRGAS